MSLRPNKAKISVKAPSNIAWIKYWGKTGVQLPMNASISMTLSNCFTKTDVEFEFGEALRPDISFLFHGKENESFLPKIDTFVERIKDDYPFVSEIKKLKIYSENTFPHSSGIASSASAFAALAFAFENVMAKISSSEIDLKRASSAARLGSGSACRSLFGQINQWGELESTNGSDEHSIAVENVHEIFKGAKNAVLVVSSEKKSVGSTLGHSLMKGHPYARARIHQANQNAKKALEDIKNGDVWSLGKIIEEEAMSLHALMMTSSPSFMLMKPNTMEIIDKVKAFRSEFDIPIFFTLDAGPNPHLLYFASDSEKVEEFIKTDLAPLCENSFIIFDEIGSGAQVLEASFE